MVAPTRELARLASLSIPFSRRRPSSQLVFSKCLPRLSVPNTVCKANSSHYHLLSPPRHKLLGRISSSQHPHISLQVFATSSGIVEAAASFGQYWCCTSTTSCDNNNNHRVFSKMSASVVSTTSKVMAKLMSTVVPPRPASSGSGIPIKPPESKAPVADPRGVKQVKINACGELYKELSKTKPFLFSKAPRGRGIDFNTTYYDSLELLEPNKRETAPIVCLLHGAPGHFNDFDELIKFLTDKGFRVVAPSFPDYSATFEHHFRHSPRERVDFLMKFFQAIGVDQIDMLVGHSSAVYTIFELLNQNLNSTTGISKVDVKSLGLFSTPTYNLPANMAVTPFRLFTLKLFDYPLLRPIIIALIHTFVKLQGIQNRVDKSKIDNLLIAASAVGYSDSEKMEDYIKLVHRFKIPTFVLFGCNDRLIPMRSFSQLKRDLQVASEGQVKQYNKEGKLISGEHQIEADKLVLVSQFDFGGHYVFQRYSEQVNEDIYGFLSAKVLKGVVAGNEPATITRL